MATLLDTSSLVVMIRSRRPHRLEGLAGATRDEIVAGRALLSVVSAAELLVGARDRAGARALEELVESVPLVAADREVAVLAGRLGASVGAAVPLPDLIVAATAIHLNVPLLTCDSDFGRLVLPESTGGDEALGSNRDARGQLRLHAASVV